MKRKEREIVVNFVDTMLIIVLVLFYNLFFMSVEL